MEGQTSGGLKKKWGAEIVGIMFPHFQFVSYAYAHHLPFSLNC